MGLVDAVRGGANSPPPGYRPSASYVSPSGARPGYRPGYYRPLTQASALEDSQAPLMAPEDGPTEIVQTAPPTTMKRMFTTWASSTFILIYFLMMIVAIWKNDGFEPFSTNPMLGPSIYTLNDLGANNAAEMKYKEELWRLVTPIFLHAGVIHLAFNVYVQNQIGSDLEMMWGTWTWLAIFMVGGAFGNLASCIFLPTTIGVGASGGIMAMLGGWFVELICHWRDDDPIHFLDPAEAKFMRKQRIKQLAFLGLNIAITFALSIVPMVDWAAHVGGCIGGMIIGGHLFSADVMGACSRTCTLWISSGLVVVLAVGGLWYFFDDIEPCPNKNGDFTDYIPPAC